MSVVCFGELLIDFVALESGVTVGDASGFEKAPGGAPANVAVAVARLGHPSAFLGQVGDDPFGHFLAGVLKAEGVNIDGLRFSDEARTALAFVALAARGERSFVFYRHPSADKVMTPEDVDLNVINQGKIFHYSGSLTLVDEPSRSATLTAAQHARDNGLLVSYDPNLRLMLWPDADTARAGLLDALDYANVVKLSDEELEFLTGGRDVAPLWRDSIELIVVTRGEQGATAYTRENQISQPGMSMRSVDTTGAGDTFMAALLVGILENETDYLDKLAPILRFANAAAALTVTNRGAIPALPFRPQVDMLLSE